MPVFFDFAASFTKATRFPKHPSKQLLVARAGQPKSKQYVGDPYVKRDSFYVFDDFDFPLGFKIYDNRNSLRNIRHFVANDAIPTFYNGRRLSSEGLVEYLAMEERKEGNPIFVDNPALDLTEPEQLEVIFVHLMRDFDSAFRKYEMPEDVFITKRHLENMRAYLLENQEDDLAMTAMIEMVKAGRLQAIKNKKSENKKIRQKSEVKAKQVRVDGTFAHKKKNPDAPTIAWYEESGAGK